MSVRIFNCNYMIDTRYGGYRLYRVANRFSAFRPWVVSGAGRTASFPTCAEAIAHADRLTSAIREGQ